MYIVARCQTTARKKGKPTLCIFNVQMESTGRGKIPARALLLRYRGTRIDVIIVNW